VLGVADMDRMPRPGRSQSVAKRMPMKKSVGCQTDANEEVSQTVAKDDVLYDVCGKGNV